MGQILACLMLTAWLFYRAVFHFVFSCELSLILFQNTKTELETLFTAFASDFRIHAAVAGMLLFNLFRPCPYSQNKFLGNC